MVHSEENQVDSLTGEKDSGLEETNKISLAPIIEFPRMVCGELHHCKALLGLTCQRDMHNKGAYEPCDHCRV